MKFGAPGADRVAAAQARGQPQADAPPVREPVLHRAAAQGDQGADGEDGGLRRAGRGRLDDAFGGGLQALQAVVGGDHLAEALGAAAWTIRVRLLGGLAEGAPQLARAGERAHGQHLAGGPQGYRRIGAHRRGESA